MTNSWFSPGDLVKVINYDTFGYDVLGTPKHIRINTIMMIIASSLPIRQLHYGVLVILSEKSSTSIVEVDRCYLKCIE